KSEFLFTSAFPRCNHCGHHVRFVLVRGAIHIDSHEHFKKYSRLWARSSTTYCPADLCTISSAFCSLLAFCSRKHFTFSSSLVSSFAIRDPVTALLKEP